MTEQKLDDVIEITKILYKRMLRLKTKLEKLHDSSSQVKRFSAYLKVLDEYQIAFEQHLQFLGNETFMEKFNDVKKDSTGS